MKLDSAESRAQSVTTRLQAARLYNSIEYELALGENTPEQDAEGELALTTLRKRFPGIEQDAREVEEPPELSRRASRRARGPHDTPRPRANRRTGTEPERGSQTPTPRTGRASGTARGPRSSVTGARVKSTVLGGFDATDAALGGIRVLLLVGLGYFILTRRGSAAFSTILGGFASGVRLVVSPVDPLGGSSSGALGAGKPSAGAGAAAGAAANAAGSAASAGGRGIVTGATGPRGSHVRQSIGPHGGGAIRLPHPLVQGF